MELTKMNSAGTPEVITVALTDNTYVANSPSARWKGTLITSNAASGPNSTIPNDTFDKEISKFGELIKQTALQNHRGSNILNRNRYCVIDLGDKVIPWTISVLKPQNQRNIPINLRYKGKKWFCRRCEQEQIGPCGKNREFRAAKEAREHEMINRKIVCDSTLRLVDQVGLRTDSVHARRGSRTSCKYLKR